MAGWTNRGKYLVLGYAFRGSTIPTYFYMALCTTTNAPTVDSNTLADVTQIATGNGYSDGGYQLNPGATDFDTWTEDDTNDRALVQMKDIVWTASGGGIPASGDGARYGVLTDHNATVSARQTLAFFDLTSARSISDGQTLTLQNCELRLTE